MTSGSGKRPPAVNDRIMYLPNNFCHYSAEYSAETISVILIHFCISAETVVSAEILHICRKSLLSVRMKGLWVPLTLVLSMLLIEFNVIIVLTMIMNHVN